MCSDAELLEALTQKVQVLLQEKGCTDIAVAYSGGVDSRFLCHVLRRQGLQPLALHAVGVHVPPAESSYAIACAKANGLALRTIAFNPLTQDSVLRNDTQRCYYCKGALMHALRQVLEQEQVRTKRRYLLCDGSNADDLAVYRPGLAALREADVASPLALAKITKADIRAIGAQTQLSDPWQKARPCLLTRFAYGVQPQAEVLARLAQAEQALALLQTADGQAALGDFRLRMTPEPLLQVQRWPQETQAHVERILSQYGFTPWAVRVDERISGFFDQALHANRALGNSCCEKNKTQ